MDALAKLSIEIFGDASRYASLPEYAPVADARARPGALTPLTSPTRRPGSAQRPWSIAGIVRSMILRSSQTDQRSM